MNYKTLRIRDELADEIKYMNGDGWKFGGARPQGRGHTVFFWRGTVANIEMVRFPLSKIRKILSQNA